LQIHHDVSSRLFPFLKHQKQFPSAILLKLQKTHHRVSSIEYRESNFAFYILIFNFPSVSSVANFSSCLGG